EIPMALITHLHWDHWAGYRHFPAAEFWIQRDEVAFWTGAVARYDAFKMSANPGALSELVRLNYANRVRMVHGDRQVLPGLRLHRIGVHPPALQLRHLRADGPRRRGGPAGPPRTRDRRPHGGAPDRLRRDRQGAGRAHLG